MEETPQEVTEEQIFENIRLHKEVLTSVKQQPWGMKRKLRLVNQAKAYIKKHEGALQERFAQSRCTRDIIARFNILLATKWQNLKREAANWSNWFIPWELRIKEIESHFGSVVASYFTFLRWLFWVNMVISIVLVVFIVVPEMLTADPNTAGERKKMLPEERNKSTNLLTLWEFEGVLKYSPIFYGYYTNRDPGENGGYRLPLAYFMTGLAVYIYSFVATLRKMAENSRMSKLSEKEDECIFSWKLFTGWDYMIGNTETAHNRTASIILGFKEALLEEAEKKKDVRNWKVIFKRVIVNLAVMFLLCVSAYAVVEVVRRSNESDAENNWWRQNEITIVMSLISFIFPIFFELLGLFEDYHPRRQLRIQLARIMVLNLLNLYSLIIALFDKITDMTKELQHLKPNTTTMAPITTTSKLTTQFFDETTTEYTIDHSHLTTLRDITTEISIENITKCYDVVVTCPATAVVKQVTTTLLTMLVANLTTESGLISTDVASTTIDNFIFNENLTFDPYSYSSSDPPYTPYSSSALYSSSSENPYHSSTDFQDSFDLLNTTNYNTSESTTPTYYYDNGEDGDYQYYSDEAPSDNNTEGFKQDTSDYVTSLTDDYDLSTSALEVGMLRELIPKDNNELTFLGKGCYITQCRVDDVTTVDSIDKATYKMDASYQALIQRDYPFEKANSGNLDMDTKRKLRKLCWETMFGQELVKLTMMDLVLTILATLFMDFFRAVFVRFMNSCWCWDLEKKFPQYGDFKIAENILHLVNNQGMVWMGMFFSPGLVVLNLIKLVILMYLRSWAVMTCNVPHEVVFRASRSNNFYLALLLTMLFLCVLPVGYAIVWVEPSWHCGPFSNYQRIYHLFTQSLLKFLPKSFHRGLDYIASPGIVIPLLVLLILIIYYLLSLTGALREANNDLKIQLRRERTEERRKMFQIADRRRMGGSNDLDNTPFSKWKKILPVMPTNKTTDKIGDDGKIENENSPLEKKDFLAKIVKMALRKSSGTSDDESGLNMPAAEDETDTEFHESLPEDVLNVKDIKFNKAKGTAKASNEETRKKRKETKLPKKEKTDDPKEKKGKVETESVSKDKVETPVNFKLENEVLGKLRKKRMSKNVKAVDIKESVDKPKDDDQKEDNDESKKRQDSVTSIIPMITISKTESDENILEKNKEKHDSDKKSKEEAKHEPQK